MSYVKLDLAYRKNHHNHRTLLFIIIIWKVELRKLLLMRLIRSKVVLKIFIRVSIEDKVCAKIEYGLINDAINLMTDNK